MLADFQICISVPLMRKLPLANFGKFYFEALQNVLFATPKLKPCMQGLLTIANNNSKKNKLKNLLMLVVLACYFKRVFRTHSNLRKIVDMSSSSPVSSAKLVLVIAWFRVQLTINLTSGNLGAS